MFAKAGSKHFSKNEISKSVATNLYGISSRLIEKQLDLLNSDTVDIELLKQSILDSQKKLDYFWNIYDKIS